MSEKKRNKIDGLIELIRSDGSIILNKKLAWAMGINTAILYTELVSRYKYFSDRNELDKEGYFFNTIEDLRAGTTLTRYEQDLAIRKLIKLKLIDKKIKKWPGKRYFKIKCGKVAVSTLRSLLLKDFTVCEKTTNREGKSADIEQKDPPVCKKTTNSVCKKTTNSTNNTNLNNKEKKEEERKEFFTKIGDKEKKEKKEDPEKKRPISEQIEILKKKGYKF